MPKIADSHIHIRFTEYPAITGMLDDIAGVGVQEACLLALPYRGAAENLAALYTKMQYTRIPVRAFGSLHITDRYAAVPPEEQADALLALGCDGFKLMFSPEFPRYLGHNIDDPRYASLFSLLEERQVPVNIHLADPETFWEAGGQYADPTFPSKQHLYDGMFRVLDRYPGLQVTFAHFFFLAAQPDEAIRVMETYPNVRFDLTPGVEMYYQFDDNLSRWQEFFRRYSHRILFGTDCNTIKRCNTELELLVYRKLTETGIFTQHCYGKDFTVQGLALPEEVVHRICWQNYRDFVGSTPKPVNLDLFRRCCQRILRDLETAPEDTYYRRGASLIPDLGKDPAQTRAASFCRMALENV